MNSLSEWLSVLWLTPAMDRLFLGPAGDRRRFLDRLVLALETGHAHHAARYEAAMRARNKLLAEANPDASWLTALEEAMAEHGAAIAAARVRTVAALDSRLAEAGGDEFPRAQACLTVSKMQLAIGETRAMAEQAGHPVARAARVLDSFAEHHVAAAFAVHRSRLRETREP